MFENIIEQDAVLRLRDDIISGRNAPSMLFFGPPDTGKGSAALELARVLSCEGDASWKCSCRSCERHRYLQHDDLLVLGPRSFQQEIAASLSAFIKNPSSLSVKLLFFRSIRKLMLRFSPILMEDDPKSGKISSVLQALDEGLSGFWDAAENVSVTASLEKICGSLVKDALALESDGIGGVIPIGHIRRASYWCRLAPNGKRKALIIENAENMRDEARNSLLKLLEEPPGSVSIVLTAQRREAIMPTILSRLRPYRFLKRSAQSEAEVIQRVFKETLSEKLRETKGSLVSAYLDSFLPQSAEKMYPLAAWFIVSLARIAAVSIKKSGLGEIPGIINALGERCAPIAEASGLERSLRGAGVVKTVISQSGNFDDASFSRFLKACLEMIGDVTRSSQNRNFIAYNDAFKKIIDEAAMSVDVLNINTTIALEALFFKLKKTMIRGLYG